jgi:hypothetical protein
MLGIGKAVMDLAMIYRLAEVLHVLHMMECLPAVRKRLP